MRKHRRGGEANATRAARLPEAHREPTAGEGGYVTVELAISFISVVLLLAFIVSLGSIALRRSETCHAARQAAREAAIGGADPVGIARHVLDGRAADIRVSRSDRWVSVDIDMPVDLPLFGTVGSTSCRAVTLVEENIP